MDVLHRIVDGKAGGHAAAGAVDVEVDGFLRVFGFEEEELGYDAGGSGLFDFAIEADYAFLEEAREDVLGVIAAALLTERLAYERAECGVTRKVSQLIPSRKA